MESGLGDGCALERRVEVGPVRADGHGLVPPAVRLRRRTPGQERVAGGQQRTRRLERWVEQPAVGVEVQDPRAELVAHPQVAVAPPLQGLGVDVGAGQEPVLGHLVDDGEPDEVIRIAELDELTLVGVDLDRAAAAAGGLEVRSDVVGADQEVRRVGLAAEPVVGHGQVLPPLPAGNDGREPRDGLLRARELDPVQHARPECGPRRRPEGQRLGGEHRPTDERRLLVLVVVRVRSDRGKGQCRRDGGDDDSEQPRVHLRLLSTVECRLSVRHPSSRAHEAEVTTQTQAPPGTVPGGDRDTGTIRPGHRPPYCWRRPGGARMEQPDERSSTHAPSTSLRRARVAGAVTAASSAPAARWRSSGCAPRTTAASPRARTGGWSPGS